MSDVSNGIGILGDSTRSDDLAQTTVDHHHLSSQSSSTVASMVASVFTSIFPIAVALLLLNY